jgi:hypothetical protein
VTSGVALIFALRDQIQHIVVWFIIVASLVIHRPQLQGWIWAGFALHLLDRVARGCRIAYYAALKTVTPHDDAPEGTVTVLTRDTIRVSVRTRQGECGMNVLPFGALMTVSCCARCVSDWIAGQHVYLHCPKQSPGGHPFTSESAVADKMEEASVDRGRHATFCQSQTSRGRSTRST